MQQDVTSGKRILIVDDDPSARNSIKLLLSIDRHLVTEAQDGIEALALITEQPFDLVLLDFFMPGMHGGEVARRIRQIAPSLPILMVTAYVEKLTGSDGRDNTNAVLAKPFGVNVLRGEISKLLPSDSESDKGRN
ncbi:MAG TPA: response regulator [Candidatus Angelobacter sp.]|nr:response regulator [Candidatus Angelobacter sp.]